MPEVDGLDEDTPQESAIVDAHVPIAIATATDVSDLLPRRDEADIYAVLTAQAQGDFDCAVISTSTGSAQPESSFMRACHHAADPSPVSDVADGRPENIPDRLLTKFHQRFCSSCTSNEYRVRTVLLTSTSHESPNHAPL